MSGRPFFDRAFALAGILALTMGMFACSSGNDYGARLPMPATFPQVSDVPQRPEKDMSQEQQNALVEELQTLGQTHEDEAVQAIENQ